MSFSNKIILFLYSGTYGNSYADNIGKLSNVQNLKKNWFLNLVQLSKICVNYNAMCL